MPKFLLQLLALAMSLGAEVTARAQIDTEQLRNLAGNLFGPTFQEVSQMALPTVPPSTPATPQLKK